jgi:hypothetical protein
LKLIYIVYIISDILRFFFKKGVELDNFTSHNMRKEINEGTYMTEVILPLLSAVVPMRKGIRLITYAVKHII